MGPPETSLSRTGTTAPSQPHCDPHSSLPAPPGAASRLGHYPPHIPAASAPATSTPFSSLPASLGPQDRLYSQRSFSSEEEIRAYYDRQESLLAEDLKHHSRPSCSGGWGCLPARTTASSHVQAAPGPAKQARLSGSSVQASGTDTASLHSSPATGTATGQQCSSQVSLAQQAKSGSSCSSLVAGKSAAAESSPSVPFVVQKDALKLVINLRSTVAPLTPTETPSTTSSATSTPTTTTTASSAASASVQTVAEDVLPKQVKPKKTCIDNMSAEEIVNSVKGSGEGRSYLLPFLPLSLPLFLSLSRLSVIFCLVCMSLLWHIENDGLFMVILSYIDFSPWKLFFCLEFLFLCLCLSACVLTQLWVLI